MARIFLDANETFVLVASNAQVFGRQGGQETVQLRPEASNVTLAQTVDRVELSEAVSHYTFQQAGNRLLVKSGASTVATLTVQDDTDGTVLSFAGRSASAKIVGGVMRLGEATVSSSAAVTLSDADLGTGTGTGSTGTGTGSTGTGTGTGTLPATRFVALPAADEGVVQLRVLDAVADGGTFRFTGSVANATIVRVQMEAFRPGQHLDFTAVSGKLPATYYDGGVAAADGSVSVLKVLWQPNEWQTLQTWDITLAGVSSVAALGSDWLIGL